MTHSINNKPTIACLCPTIPAHERFLQAAVDSIHNQQCPKGWDMVLHVDGDPLPTLGGKLNRMVKHAISLGAEFVVLCDSDDLHHPTRVQRQIMPLLENPTLLLTGTAILVYHDVRTKELWRYSGNKSLWLGGLSFPTAAWKRYQFDDTSAGVDNSWQKKFAPDTRLDLRDESLMLCTAHQSNTCRKTFVGREWSRLSGLPPSLLECLQ
jgi:glycosyltransferase involved in cell wall biosynthesis